MKIRSPGRVTGWRQAFFQLGVMAIWLQIWMIMPVALWLAGDERFPSLVMISVLVHLGATLIAAGLSWPALKVIRYLLVILVFTWLLEAIGSGTGVPFGDYQYTRRLPLQLAGVPLVIPLAWATMLFPAWAVAESILSKWRVKLGRGYWWAFAGLTGAAFTAWDLYLDPQMVARDLWVWTQPGGYFGIPWINYIAWWLSTAILTLLLRPANLANLWLLIVYSLTWLFQGLGLALFWQLPGPALAGFLGMGFFVLLSWRGYRERF